jgi:hypothetical protein
LPKKKGRSLVARRPKSREETPKEGSGKPTPIDLPHRNKMPMQRTKIKDNIFDLMGQAVAADFAGHVTRMAEMLAFMPPKEFGFRR